MSCNCWFFFTCYPGSIWAKISKEKSPEGCKFMRRRILGLLVLSTLFLCLRASGQQISPDKPSDSELITPVNAQPLSIETVTRRRGLMVDTPAKNIIIFTTTGFSGASAAFGDACTGRKRDDLRWQGIQQIYPIWADPHKSGSNNLIRALSRIGKKLGLVSDFDFYLSGLVEGNEASATAELSNFSVALSFSDQQDSEKRATILEKAGSENHAALDYAGLEKLFTRKSQHIIGCFAMPVEGQPGFAELVSSVVSRMALAPEGFCLVVNFSETGRARDAGKFTRMVECLKIRESVLQQLETFVAGRKDTLMLVIDEPENGSWKAGEAFSTDAFISSLRKIPAAVKEIVAGGSDPEKILNTHFSGTSFDISAVNELAASGQAEKLTTLIEAAVSVNNQLQFTACSGNNATTGHTVLAQGLNADLFFGISSFSEFYKRLELAIGLNAGEK